MLTKRKLQKSQRTSQKSHPVDENHVLARYRFYLEDILWREDDALLRDVVRYEEFARSEEESPREES